jgi:hypothetical protein
MGITKPLNLRLRLTRFRPMRAPDFAFLTNKSFKNKFNNERDGEGLSKPFLDIIGTKKED